MDLLKYHKDLLANLLLIYDANEANIITRMTIDALKSADIDSIQIIATKYLNELSSGRPIQYVLGKAYFSDFELFVNEHVLIPRPETDELVYHIIHEHKNHPNLHIWDIGTGSGCIDIALFRHLINPIITSTDLSHKAIEIATINANNLNAHISFIQHDILNDSIQFIEKKSLDIIVSNPPYIGKDEANSLEKHVIAFEPQQALFVTNDDPLQFYKKIASIAKEYLNDTGTLYFELHSQYAFETKDYLESNGWKCNLLHDMQSLPRILICKQ